MEYNEVSLKVMEMLLDPLDSNTLRNLYVKAPRKSIGALPKKIPKKIREKAIHDLTTKKNMQYLLGRLDAICGFYNSDSGRKNINGNFSYLQFEKLCLSLDANASVILLHILQENGYSGINNFFSGDLKKIEKIRYFWLKIDWKNGNPTGKNIKLDVTEQDKYKKQLESQKNKNLLLSSKLKKEQNKFVIDLNNQKNKYLAKIKQEQKKYIENNEQKNKRIDELLELLNEKKEKYNVLQKKIDEQKITVNSLKTRIENKNNLMKQVLQEKNFPIKIIVAKKSNNYVKGSGYIYISPTSLDDIIDTITVLDAEYLYLFQETTTPKMQYQVKKRLLEQKHDTKLRIISMIDLQGKGENIL